MTIALATTQRVPTIKSIISTVAERSQVPIDELLLKRNPDTAWERHVAMYLARVITGKSFPFIAKSFNSHATTPLKVFCRVTKAMRVDRQLSLEIAALRSQIEASR